MTDFKKMAVDAKSSFEAKETERARKQAEEEAARNKITAAGSDRLQKEVMPVLEAAKQ